MIEVKLEDMTIDGYFFHKGGTRFASVPLLSEITPCLWVGGCKNFVELPHDFTHVFSLYMWERYILGPDTKFVEVEMYDGAGGLDIPTVEDMSAQVVEALESKNSKILVHCQAGINRSNLVTAHALMSMGVPAQIAISLLRKQRHELVLSNEVFESWLLSL